MRFLRIMGCIVMTCLLLLSGQVFASKMQPSAGKSTLFEAARLGTQVTEHSAQPSVRLIEIANSNIRKT